MAKIDIDWFLVDVIPTFHGLLEYARIMEKQIDNLTEAERQRIQSTSYPDESEWSRELHEHSWLFEETLPRVLRYSCIVSLFTALETTMDGMCKELQMRNKLPISSKDLKGNFIKRTLIYIDKIAGINLPDHPFIKKLDDLYKVRGCIVHASGQIEGSRDFGSLPRIVDGIRGLSISHDGFIGVSPGACENIISEAFEWIGLLLDSSGFRHNKKG